MRSLRKSPETSRNTIEVQQQTILVERWETGLL